MWSQSTVSYKQLLVHHKLTKNQTENNQVKHDRKLQTLCFLQVSNSWKWLSPFILVFFSSLPPKCELNVFVQALLSSTVDRSSMLEAHMVSANSRYIEEQQEQQQVDKRVEENESRPLMLCVCV